MFKSVLRWLNAAYTIVFYLVVTALTLALLLVCGLSCFGAAHLYCELSCHLIVLYLLAAFFVLLVVGLDAAIFRRMSLIARIDIGCLFLILFYCGYKMAPLWMREDKAPQRANLTLLHFNLHGDKNKDYQSFFEQIADANPDIVMVSESSKEWSRVLAKKLEAQYPYFDKSGFKSEFGFYSKYPIKLYNLKEIEFVHRKRLFAQVVHPELGPITILLVHPVTPIFNFAARNEELALYPKELKEFDTPRILVGDMNCTLWSPYYERMVKEGELKDCERGFGFAPTWPGVTVKPFITIDHFLVSKDLAVKDRRVLGYAGSDHLPVLVKLGLAEPLTASTAPTTYLTHQR